MAVARILQGGVNMDEIGTIASIGALVVSALLAYLSKATLADLNKLRAEIAEARLQDTIQTRAWINGSFMKASDVRAELVEMSRAAELARKELEHRVEVLEAARDQD